MKSVMFRIVFWDVLPCKIIPEDNSEHHTRRRENFKSHTELGVIITQMGTHCMKRFVRYHPVTVISWALVFMT
jgi:hypothetical protein